jgi:hypothetical protein
MRTSGLGRLLPLASLAALRISRSRSWRRWRVATLVEATADGLRTLGPNTLVCWRERGRWAGRGAGQITSGAPPQPLRRRRRTRLSVSRLGVRRIASRVHRQSPCGSTPLAATCRLAHWLWHRGRKGLRWLARYVDDCGREHSKAFNRKADAKFWLDKHTSAIVSGTHVAPRDAQLTVQQWCDLWIEGYKVNREGTVRAARTHIRQIVAEFGGMPLTAVRPSQVKAWVARLRAEGMEPSYVYALHSRLSQICSDAVHDGVLGRNPCSRRTAPPMGKPKVYASTTEQVWAIHDAVPDHLRVAVLLGAFAGLRVAEVSALRVSDVDFARGVVRPKQQCRTNRSRPPAAISQYRFRGTWRCCCRRRCRSTPAK